MVEMKTKLKASEAWIAALQSGLGSIAVASELWQGNPPSQLSGGEAALAVADGSPKPEGAMPLKVGMLPRLPCVGLSRACRRTEKRRTSPGMGILLACL